MIRSLLNPSFESLQADSLSDDQGRPDFRWNEDKNSPIDAANDIGSGSFTYTIDGDWDEILIQFTDVVNTASNSTLLIEPNPSYSPSGSDIFLSTMVDGESLADTGFQLIATGQAETPVHGRWVLARTFNAAALNTNSDGIPLIASLDAVHGRQDSATRLLDHGMVEEDIGSGYNEVDFIASTYNFASGTIHVYGRDYAP